MTDILSGIMANCIQWELQPIFKQPSKVWLILNFLFLGTLYYGTLFGTAVAVSLVKEKTK